MIPIFNELAARIQKEWKRSNEADSAFADVCCEALLALDPARHIKIDEVVRAGLTTERLPQQPDPNAEFGEPPLAVFTNERFFICVNFWLDGATDIHEHSFSGAFQVLHGGSLHTTFDFTPRRAINDHMHLGTLNEAGSEQLTVGDIRAIRGAKTIHSLFHLERPSATIVIRTHRDVCARPQFSYARGGVAYDPLYRSADVKRRLQLLRLLQRTTPDRVVDATVEWLRHADLVTRFIALRYSAQLVSPQDGDRLLDIASSLDEDVASLARATVEEDRRLFSLVTKRSTVTGADLRFFLAVLLNVRGRGRALELVGERFSDRDPVDVVIDLTRALSKLPSPATGVVSALGFPLDDTVLVAIESLLRSGEADTLLGDLKVHAKRALTRGEKNHFRLLASALKESEIFRFLLQ